MIHLDATTEGLDLQGAPGASGRSLGVRFASGEGILDGQTVLITQVHPGPANPTSYALSATKPADDAVSHPVA